MFAPSAPLVVAVVAVLVVIYLRSEGNGTGALAPVRQASTTRSSSGSSGGEQGSGSNPSSGGSAGSGSGPCEPPRVCGSQSSAGGSSTSHGSSALATYTGSVVENPYGPVQVSVTEQGGKIGRSAGFRDLRDRSVRLADPQAVT